MALTSMVPVRYGLVLVAATFGAVVAFTIIARGRISGAHTNPAVSLAAAFAGTLRRDLMFPYVFFQVQGGLVAGMILRTLFPVSEGSRFLGSTLLASGISPVSGIVIELAGTFLLATVALFTSSSLRKRPHEAILVGATLSTLILIVAPFTGASLNPARSIGPAFASGHLKSLPVYIIGPLSGGAVAGLFTR